MKKVILLIVLFAGTVTCHAQKSGEDCAILETIFSADTLRTFFELDALVQKTVLISDPAKTFGALRCW